MGRGITWKSVRRCARTVRGQRKNWSKSIPTRIPGLSHANELKIIRYPQLIIFNMQRQGREPRSTAKPPPPHSYTQSLLHAFCTPTSLPIRAFANISKVHMRTQRLRSMPNKIFNISLTAWRNLYTKMESIRSASSACACDVYKQYSETGG